MGEPLVALESEPSSCNLRDLVQMISLTSELNCALFSGRKLFKYDIPPRFDFK
jgi:hypothetical protein